MAGPRRDDRNHGFTARFRLVALGLLAFLAPALAEAHALQSGFLDLVAESDETWHAAWHVPDVNGSPMPIDAELPENCSPRRGPPPRFDGVSWVTDWRAHCPGGIASRTVGVAGLEGTFTDVLVRFETKPGVVSTLRLTPGLTKADLPAIPTSLGVLSTYFQLGIEHILLGTDHLMFVFALLLLIRNWRMLLGAVTAFTLAHSLSLAAATLGWIVVPAPPVEAIIALSIMFLAAELLRPPGTAPHLSELYPWAVAFGFGLIHGLGFARALLDVGLPEGDVPLALFAFNLGVEAGQVLFIVAVLATGLFLRRLYPKLVASVTTRGCAGLRILACLLGGTAGIWFVARVAAF